MKKILLSLFVGFVGVISFCSSFYNFTSVRDNGISISPGSTVSSGFYMSSNSLVCFYSSRGNYLSFSVDGNSYILGNSQTQVCFFNNGPSQYFSYSCTNVEGVSANLYSFEFSGFSVYCPTCPSCQTCTGYNLNVVYSGIMTDTYSINSDINLNVGQNISVDTLFFPNISLSSTCQGSSECPDGDFSGVSNFYVRHGESTWFQLTGMENYYVYLPEYLGYNFDYSNGTDLNFTVGVATDTGYINNISAIQNSKPSQEDLNKLVSEVLPLFVPGLAVILLLYFIFRFIKKVF